MSLVDHQCVSSPIGDVAFLTSRESIAHVFMEEHLLIFLPMLHISILDGLPMYRNNRDYITRLFTKHMPCHELA